MNFNFIIQNYNLDDSFLLGYYGGGNYGDELLLEVVQNIFKYNNYSKISILYQKPKNYARHHHNFGYSLVDANKKRSILKALLLRQNIVVGGGGLWGLDMNLNTFLMSFLLFVARRLLGKKVFLVGVGYYNSTTRLGRTGAWLAGKSATIILARDQETFNNFKRINKNTYLDSDIAWQIKKLNLSNYKKEAIVFWENLKLDDAITFITLRRFKPQKKNDYIKHIENYIKKKQGKNIIVALMEPKSMDIVGYKLLENWKKQFPKLQIIDFYYNPLVLFLFFQKYQKKLSYIGPQFHVILTAHLNNIPFLPVVYDNKVSELFNQIGQKKRINISSLDANDIEKFISTVS